MILVNADNKVLGRLASFVAKKALEGERVTVVNAEKAIMSGSRDAVMMNMKRRLSLKGKGNPEKGPKYSRMPDRVFRMAIRGMLPWKSRRGKEAYRLVHVYIGLPEEFAGKEFTEVKSGKEVKKFTELGTMCRLLGAKW